VTTLVPHLPDTQNLDLINPDILIFDLDTTHTEAVFSILKTHPSLLLIGISPGINLVKIWSGRQVRELSTQSLFELIDSEVNHMRVKSGGVENLSFRNDQRK
jgi:hypothetical protein